MRPDPARVALAAAIAAASEADKALAQAKGVLERAETFVSEAQSRVDQASAAVSHAVNEQGAALAEAFAGNNQGPPAMGAATRAARMRMADCEDELDASRSTLDKLRDAVREREDAVGEARRAVEEAIAGVISAHAEALLRAAQAAQHEYVERCAVLHEFQRALHPWSGEHKAAANFLGAVHFAVNRHLAEGKSAAAAEWRAAAAELARDASVRLPVLGSV